ncbi:hypothetical protein N2152v2_005788 [Parachlorella kessleri]
MAASSQEQQAWVQALHAAVGGGLSAGSGGPAAAANGGVKAPASTPPHLSSVRPRHQAVGGPGSPYASPSPQQHRRRTSLTSGEVVVASPLGIKYRSASASQDTPSLLSPTGSGSFAGGVGAASTPLSAPSSQRKRSFLHAVADVFAHAATGASSPAGSETRSLASEATLPEPLQLATSRSSASEAYNANLRPLAAGRLPPMRQLMERLAHQLPGESLAEQYQRALLYVSSHSRDFTEEKLEILQAGAEAGCYLLGGSVGGQMSTVGWQAIVAGCAGDSHAATAGRAMYVLEVTRSNPGWSCWSEHDTLYVSPENMVSELRRWPGVPTLEDLKECLDFSSSAWAGLYCQLHGAELLLEALLVHLEALDEGTVEASEAVTAALQCLHALVSGASGMEACVGCKDFIPAVCLALEPREAARSELVVQLLAKVCLYSQAGYAAVIQTLLGEPVTTLPAAGPVVSAVAEPSTRDGSLAASNGHDAPQQRGGTLAAEAGCAVPGRAASGAPPPPPPPPKPRTAGTAAHTPPPAPPPPPKPSSRGPVAGSKPPPAPPPPPKPPSKVAAAASKLPPAPPPPPYKRPAGAALPAAALADAAKPAPATRLVLPLAASALGAPSQPSTSALVNEGPGPAGQTEHEPSQSASASSSAALGEQQQQQEARSQPHESAGALVSQIQTALSTPLPNEPGRSISGSSGPVHIGGLAWLHASPRSRRDLCQLLLDLMKAEDGSLLGEAGDSLDVDLSDHVIRLISIACVSLEAAAPATAPLRKRFVEALLERGLLKVMADIAGDYENQYLRQELELLKMHIHEVLAPPKTPPQSPAVASLPATSPAPVPPKPPPKAGPPPPPPPPGGAKRPPPPPPPGRKPGAPAPPPALAARPKADPGPQPGVKMRSLFWDRLPDGRVEGTFWEKHVPAYAQLDLKEAEGLFQAMQRKTEEKNGSSASAASPRKAKQLAVLDLKRATGIGIRMARLAVPWQQIPAAAAALDPSVFRSSEDVQAVLQCLPTDDEAQMLGSYLRSGGQLDSMSEAEAFCWQLAQVLRLPERLRTFLLKFEAPLQLADAQFALQTHCRAQQELTNSRVFALLLERALAVGNFLNWGTRLGAAGGFRLKSLRKLQDTRSLDGKTTLLAWLAAGLCASAPPAPLLTEELPHVASPKLRVSLAEVAEVLSSVEASITAVESELQRCGPPACVRLVVCGAPATTSNRGSTGAGSDPSSQAGASVAHEGQEHVKVELLLDGYQDVMASTVTSLQQQLAEAKHGLQAAKEGFASLATLFGENSAALGSEQELWGDVQIFVEQFTAAQKAALAQQRAAQKDGAEKGGRKTIRTQAKQSKAQATNCDAVVSLSAVPGGGLAKKQLSFCSSTVSMDGSVAVGRSDGSRTDFEQLSDA